MTRQLEILEEDVTRICKVLKLEELRGKTLLLTGASGLLGVYFLACLRHLNKHLNYSISVYAVVYSQPESFFKTLADFEKVSILIGDISNHEFLESLPSADYIIHAAGYGQPGRFTSDPVRTLELNILSTLALLRKLKKNGKFLFTSSAEVYTGLESPPFKETEIGTTNTTHPRSCYIEGKRAGEAICQAFRSKGVDAKSARISLTYGPGTRSGDTRVLPMLIEKALNGSIDLLDGGEAKRSFLYVADAVEMMWKILLNGREPIYNVGGDDEVSILELAEKIGKILKAPVQTSKTLGLSGAPVVVRLDMSHLERDLGKSSARSLDKGLVRTIEWHQELRKN